MNFLPGPNEVWVARLDGNWSADGRALLAGLANELGAVPYAVNPHTGSVRRIGGLDYSASPEGLSRDGRFVLVSYTPPSSPGGRGSRSCPLRTGAAG
jgi:hypothetical protein